MHEFLFPDPDAQHDPVDLVLKLREVIGERPPTAATFRLTSVLPTPINQGIWVRAAAEEAVQPYSWSNTEKLLWMCGAWRVPEWFSEGHTKKSRVVNPNATQDRRIRYADGLAECDCGTLIRDNAHDPEQDGERQCTRFDHLDAQKRLWHRRRAIIWNGYRLNVETPLIASRCGLRNYRAMMQKMDELGLPSVSTMQANADLEMGETYLVLVHTYGYTAEEAAGVYDLGPKALQRRAQQAIDRHGSRDAILARWPPRNRKGERVPASTARSRPANEPLAGSTEVVA